MSGARLPDAYRKSEQGAVAKVLGAKLNGRAAAFEGTMHHEGKIGARLFRIRDQVDGEPGGEGGQAGQDPN